MSADRRDSDADRRGGRRKRDKIACPACGGMHSTVLPIHHQTLSDQRSGGYRRRRRCDDCGQEFDTREDVVPAA